MPAAPPKVVPIDSKIGGYRFRTPAAQVSSVKQDGSKSPTRFTSRHPVKLVANRNLPNQLPHAINRPLKSTPDHVDIALSHQFGAKAAAAYHKKVEKTVAGKPQEVVVHSKDFKKWAIVGLALVGAYYLLR